MVSSGVSPIVASWRCQNAAHQTGGSKGNLCLGGRIGRYRKDVANSGPAGMLVLALDLTNTPTPSGPVAILSGETWNFQCWFRDNNPNPTSNFTDARAVTFD